MPLWAGDILASVATWAVLLVACVAIMGRARPGFRNDYGFHPPIAAPITSHGASPSRVTSYLTSTRRAASSF